MPNTIAQKNAMMNMMALIKRLIMLVLLVTLDTGLAPAIDVLSVLVTTPGAG